MNQDPPTQRDLAIDAALRRLLLFANPNLSETEIQAQGRMDIGQGWYLASINARPVALVQLEGVNQFRMTII